MNHSQANKYPKNQEEWAGRQKAVTVVNVAGIPAGGAVASLPTVSFNCADAEKQGASVQWCNVNLTVSLSLSLSVCLWHF
jgi:hypothetical protein